MQTSAGIAGHPLHPMLVAFPIGLWVFSFAADLIYAGTHNTAWVTVAYYTMAGGIIVALMTAVPGAIDLFSMTRSYTRRTGTWHVLINVTVLVLFAINLWHRSFTREVTSGLMLLSGIGIALLAISMTRRRLSPDGARQSNRRNSVGLEGGRLAQLIRR